MRVCIPNHRIAREFPLILFIWEKKNCENQTNKILNVFQKEKKIIHIQLFQSITVKILNIFLVIKNALRKTIFTHKKRIFLSGNNQFLTKDSKICIVSHIIH